MCDHISYTFYLTFLQMSVNITSYDSNFIKYIAHPSPEQSLRK